MGQTVVNLRETEYQDIMRELKRMHTEQLEEIRAAVVRIRAMALTKGVFSAQLTSNRISEVMDTIAFDIVSPLEQAFRDSEACMETMIGETIAADNADG